MWAPGCSHMEHPLAPAPSWSSCEGQDDGDNIVFIDSCYLGLLEKKALACEVRRIGCLLWESRDSCEVWGAGAGAGTGNGAGEKNQEQKQEQEQGQEREQEQKQKRKQKQKP